MKAIEMNGVTEYAEGYPVKLNMTAPDETNPNRPVRIVIEAKNEGGCNITQVDLLELLTWVKANRKDIWDSI